MSTLAYRDVYILIANIRCIGDELFVLHLIVLFGPNIIFLYTYIFELIYEIS